MTLAGVYGFYVYPDVPLWVVWVSFGVAVYYVAISLWMQRKEKPVS
jgi:hypothetical protein